MDVQWDQGRKNSYRYGKDSAFDIKVGRHILPVNACERHFNGNTNFKRTLSRLPEKYFNLRFLFAENHKERIWLVTKLAPFYTLFLYYTENRPFPFQCKSLSACDLHLWVAFVNVLKRCDWFSGGRKTFLHCRSWKHTRLREWKTTCFFNLSPPRQPAFKLNALRFPHQSFYPLFPVVVVVSVLPEPPTHAR